VRISYGNGRVTDETEELYTSSKKEKIVQHNYDGGRVLAILRCRYTKKKRSKRKAKKKKKTLKN
jgi:hypothetical protein